MPASPSSAALNPAFNMRSAIGDSVSIRRHHATVSASRSASGTTVLTSPHDNAWAASYWRHKNQISLARFNPIVRANSPEPYPPSKLPTLGPVWPNRALSAAIVKSQTRCNTWPPPIA